jgi:hypothetical protein
MGFFAVLAFDKLLFFVFSAIVAIGLVCNSFVSRDLIVV